MCFGCCFRPTREEDPRIWELQEQTQQLADALVLLAHRQSELADRFNKVVELIVQAKGESRAVHTTLPPSMIMSRPPPVTILGGTIQRKDADVRATVRTAWQTRLLPTNPSEETA